MARQRKYNLNWFRLVLIIVVAYFLYICTGQQMELTAIRHEADITRADLIQLSERNQKLQQERALLSTPAYVEKLAREELGLVKPGEIPYISAGKN